MSPDVISSFSKEEVATALGVGVLLVKGILYYFDSKNKSGTEEVKKKETGISINLDQSHHVDTTRAFVRHDECDRTVKFIEQNIDIKIKDALHTFRSELPELIKREIEIYNATNKGSNSDLAFTEMISKKLIDIYIDRVKKEENE